MFKWRNFNKAPPFVLISHISFFAGIAGYGDLCNIGINLQIT
jgi:hypothetical protein